MHARAAIALVVAAGCYEAPAAPAACSITCIDTCPGELACVNGFCVAGDEVCTPTFARVSAGAGYACALDGGGKLWCWGSNAHHQIDPSDRPAFELPTRVGATEWDDISTGRHTCGITGGRLLCWGANDRGQVSGAIEGDVAEPLEIRFEGEPARWTAVTAAYSATCAIGDGRLFCWGAGDDGLLGTGATDDVPAPTAVTTALADWTAVSIGWTQDSSGSGNAHACAISASTGLWCWGANGNGELGDGTAMPQLAPVPVPLPAPPASVAAGAYSTCATTTGQQLYCWGYAGANALGDPALIPVSGNQLSPALASGLAGWTKVASGEQWACGLRGDEVWCWGQSSSAAIGSGIWSRTRGWGRVGDGATDLSVGANTTVDDAGTNLADLDLACLVADGEVRCWGDNRYGQLGQGAASQAARPVEVAGGRTWSALAAGAQHACGIAGNDLLCWGSTINGQANGVASGISNAPCGAFAGLACDVLVPSKMRSVNAPQQIAPGAAHTCAFGSALTCWGDNGLQQLGAGGLPPSPVEIPGPWTSLFPTRGNTPCAVQNGQTHCWGSFVMPSPPTHIARLDGMTMLNASSSIASSSAGHGCYLDANRELLCFGANALGQYGNGAATGLACFNNKCDAGETSATCPNDCGMAPMSRLGRTYRAISVGWGSSSSGSFTCGIRDTDGGVECWGRNRSAVVSATPDPGMTQPPAYVYTPATIPDLSGCTAVSAGDATACALCGGDIYCWGDHQRGAVGAGPLSAAPVTTPRKIEATLDEGDAWAELTAGAGFACARTTLGRAYCWGANIHGALGTGGGAANLPTPLRFERP